jgi:AhpD family alkylhydroperoxidase
MKSEEIKMIRKDVKKFNKKMNEAMPKMMEKIRELRDTALEEGVLSLKVKELIALGMAIAKQSPYCIVTHVINALHAGATKEEIWDVCRVAILMGGGPSVAYSRFAVKAVYEMGNI